MSALHGLSSNVQAASKPLFLQTAIDAFGTSSPRLSDYLTKAALHCDGFRARFAERAAQNTDDQKIGAVQAIWGDFTGFFSDVGEMFEKETPLPPSQEELFSSLFQQGRTGLEEINENLDRLESFLTGSQAAIPEIRQQRFILDSCPPKETQGIEAAKNWAESIEVERKRSADLLAAFHKTAAEERSKYGNAGVSETLRSMVGAALPEPMKQESIAAMFAEGLGKNTKISHPDLGQLTASLKPLIKMSKDLEFQTAAADMEAFEQLLGGFRAQMKRYPFTRFLSSDSEYEPTLQSAVQRLHKEIAKRIDDLDANHRSSVTIPLQVDEPILEALQKMTSAFESKTSFEDFSEFANTLKRAQSGTVLLQIEKGAGDGLYAIRMRQSGEDCLFKKIKREKLIDPGFLEGLLKATLAIGEAEKLKPLIEIIGQNIDKNWKESANSDWCDGSGSMLVCIAYRLLSTGSWTAGTTIATRMQDVMKSIATLSGLDFQKTSSFQDFLKDQLGTMTGPTKVSLAENPWEIWEILLKEKKELAFDLKLASLVHSSQTADLPGSDTEILLNLNKAALSTFRRHLNEELSIPKEKFLYADSLLSEAEGRIEEKKKAYFRALDNRIPPVSTEPFFGGLGNTLMLPEQAPSVSDAPALLIKFKPIEDFTGWDPSFDGAGRMIDFAAKLNAEYANENYDGIIVSIKSFFDSFNLASLDDYFWNMVDEEKAEQIFLSLETISNFYFKSYFDANVPRLPDAESGLLMMEAMAIADRLMGELPPSHQLNDQHMPLKELAPYLFNRAVFYQLSDPKLEKRQAALQRYCENDSLKSLYEQKNDGDSLFETNLAPLKRTGFGFISGDLLGTPKIMLAGFEPNEYVIKAVLAAAAVAAAQTGEEFDEERILKELKTKTTSIAEEQHLKDYLDLFASTYPTSLATPDKYKEMLTGDFLPKPFYAARRIAFNTEYFFRGTFLKPPGFKKTENSYQVSFEGVSPVSEVNPVTDIMYRGIGIKAWFIYAKVEGIDESVFEDNSEVPDGMSKAHQFHHLHRPLSTEQAGLIIKQLEGRHLTRIEEPERVARSFEDQYAKFIESLVKQFFVSPTRHFRSFSPGITEAGRNIYDLNVVMVQETEELKKHLTKQEYEVFASLRTEPAVQIGNTLSFFRNKPNLLHDPDMQAYFSKLIFDAPLLSKELSTKKRGPELERQLAEFVENEYRLSSQLGKKVAADFFLGLASRLRQYSSFARTDHPDIYENHQVPPFFADFESTLAKALKAATPGSIGTIHGLFAEQMMAKESLKKDEVESFLGHVLLYHSSPPSGKTVDPFLSAGLKRLLGRFAPSIAKALQNDSSFLDRIARAVYPQLPPNPEFRLSPHNTLVYTANDGTILDLQQGIVIAPGIHGIPLPADALGSPIYMSLYKTKEFRCQPIGMSTFEFTDQNKAVNRLIRQSDGQFAIQRKFPKGWYQYVPKDVLLGKNEAQTEVEKKIKQLLDSKSRQALPALPLIKGHTHWLRMDAPGELLILNAKTGRQRYRAEIGASAILKMTDSHQILRKIHKSAVDSRDQFELVDLKLENEAFSWLFQFEDPNQTLVWKDPGTKETARIEFPRFGLAFAREGTLFKSEQFAGFYLKRHQINPLGANTPNFLILQNKKGEEKLLLAAQQIVPSQGSSLSSRLTFDRETNVMKAKPSDKKGEQSDDLDAEQSDEFKVTQSYFTYDKAAGAKKFSNLDDSNANFYLALIHGAKKQIKDAMVLLRQFGQSSTPFTPEEKAILGWISGLNQIVQNETPPLTSLRALAQAILAQNKEGEQEKKPAAQEVQGLEAGKNIIAEAYFKVLPKLGLFRLHIEEELTLLGLIEDKDPNELEKIKALKIAHPDRAKEAIALMGAGKALKSKTLDAWLKEPLFGKRAAAPESVPLQPIIENPLDFVEISKEANTDLTKSELEELLLRQGTNPIENEAFDFYLKDTLHYLESKDKNLYQLKDPARLKQKRIELEKTVDYVRESLAGIERALLRLASKTSEDREKAARMRSSQDGDASAPIELDELILLYMKNELGSLKSRNPELTSEDIDNLDLGIGLFIDLTSQNAQRTRVVDAMRDIEKLDSLEKSEEKDLQLKLALSEFVKAAKVERHFAPTEKNRFLKVFEFYNSFYYLPEHTQILPELGVEIDRSTEPLVLENLIRELMVGKGKTIYLLPTKAYWSADGKSLSMVIMTEELIDNMRKVEKILGKTYGQGVKRFQFSINTDLDEENLTDILKMLNGAIERKECVITTGRDLKAFSNQFKIAIRSFSKDFTSPKLARRAELMTEILVLFRELGKPMADEADLIFAALRELNFPSGNPESIPSSFLSLSLKIYELLTSSEILKIASFEFFPSKANACTPKVFEEEVKPLLVNKTLDFLAQGTEIPSLHQFYRKCTPEQKEMVKNYFLGADPEHTAEKWIGRLSDKELRDHLGLIHGLFNIHLPLTLQKNFGEHYGYHSKESVTAGPYSGSNSPNLGSAFSDPFEGVCYTIQACFKEAGIRREIIKKLVHDLQGRALKEINENNAEYTKNPNYKTKAHLEFEGYFGVRDDLPLFNDDIVDRLMKCAINDPKIKSTLLEKYILPEIKIYPENLEATSQIFGFLFKIMKGFTGTMTNEGTFHDSFRPKDGEGKTASPRFDLGARGQIIALAYSQTKDKVETLLPKNPANLPWELIVGNPKYSHIRALIDAGGALKGFDLEKTAKTWLDELVKKGSSLQGVVFFDTKDRAMIWERGEPAPIPFEKSACPIEKRITIYDQKHTTGIDIKQAIDAVALVTVSKGMIMRDFVQAVGRMRKIASGQRIELLVLESDALAMRELLGLPSDHKLKGEDVIRYLIRTEVARQCRENEVATTHKISAIVEEWFLTKFLQLKDLSGMGALADLIEPLFFEKKSISPFLNYGQGTDLVDAMEAFNDRIKRAIGKLNLTEGAEKNELIALLNQTVANTKLPPKIPKSSITLGMEQQVELAVEQQRDLQQELQQEQRVEQDNEKRPKIQPAPHHAWSLDADSVEKSKVYAHHRIDRFKSANSIVGQMPIFDEEFLLSDNFQNHLHLGSSEPFGIFQKPIQNILIVKNKRTNQFQLMAVEPYDAAAFKKALQEKQGERTTRKDSDLAKTSYFSKVPLDFSSQQNGWDLEKEAFRNAPTEGDDVQVWIGDLDLNSLYESDPPIPKSELKTDPQLARLLVQAKYFNGEVHYPVKELDLLKIWLKERAVNKSWKWNYDLTKETNIEMGRIEQHFREKILPFKEQSKRDYKNSALFQAFKELKGEQK